MANFESTADLLKGALQRSGEVTDGSSLFHSLALKYMNQTYMAVLSGANEFNIDMGEPWPWALSPTPKILTLLPKQETGTISLTQDSTSGTFSSAPTVSVEDYILRIDNHDDMYRIASHTASATPCTLDGGYTGDTDSALGFEALKVRYSLGTDVLRLVEPFTVYKDALHYGDNEGRIYGIDRLSFRRMFPLKDLIAGIPTRFYKFYDSSATLHVEFNAYATERSRIEIDYIPIPTMLIDSDASIPLIPRQHRAVLEYGCAYFLMLDKEDPKAEQYLRMTQAKLTAMISAARRETTYTSRNKGRIIPRLEDLNTAGINSGDPYT